MLANSLLHPGHKRLTRQQGVLYVLVCTGFCQGYTACSLHLEDALVGNGCCDVSVRVELFVFSSLILIQSDSIPTNKIFNYSELDQKSNSSD